MQFFAGSKTAARTIISVNSSHRIMVSDVLGYAVVSIIEFIIWSCNVFVALRYGNSSN